MFYSKATKILQYYVIQLIPKNNSSKEITLNLSRFYCTCILQSGTIKRLLNVDYLKTLKLNNIILFTLLLTFCHTKVLRRWIQPNVE